jgi:hypothetical protein
MNSDLPNPASDNPSCMTAQFSRRGFVAAAAAVKGF